MRLRLPRREDQVNALERWELLVSELNGRPVTVMPRTRAQETPAYVLAGLSLSDAPADRDGVSAEDYLNAAVEYDLAIVEYNLPRLVIPKSNPYVHMFGAFFGARDVNPLRCFSPVRTYPVPYRGRGLVWREEQGGYRVIGRDITYQPGPERERLVELAIRLLKKARRRPDEIDWFEMRFYSPESP